MRSIETIRYMLPRIERAEDLDIDEAEYKKHIKLMMSAELIEGKSMRGDGEVHYGNLKLTMKGQDFYAAISNPVLWKRVVEKVEGLGMSIDELPLQVVEELGNAELKRMLGL